MRKPLSITIHLPDPCNENWDEMKPNGCGRFCAHCEKTVIDFTQMSDEEVVKIMMNATKTPCGRFDETQLNRPLLIPQKKSAKPFPNLLSKVAASLLLIQTLVSNAFAQKKEATITEQISDITTAQKNNQVLIQGSIKDNNTDEPLIGMEISISGVDYVKYSDAKGHFGFVLPDSFKGEEIVINAKYQPSSSKELSNTMIQEEKVLIPQNGDSIDVHLVRYPYQTLDKVMVETPYYPRPSGKVNWRENSNGGDPVVKVTTKKSEFNIWLHNLFKKKKK